jgi:hypothetical protein
LAEDPMGPDIRFRSPRNTDAMRHVYDIVNSRWHCLSILIRRKYALCDGYTVLSPENCGANDMP